MRSLGRIIAISLFLIALGGCTQETHKIYRIGILSGLDTFMGVADGFKTGMSELGYAEDRDIVYSIRNMHPDPEGIRSAARELVEDKVDLILAFPTNSALAAKASVKGTGIPIVFAMSSIEGNDLVKCVSAPGDNITRVRFPNPELTAKRLEIINELAPQARRVYLVYDPDYPSVPFALQALDKTAARLGVTLVKETVNDLQGLKAVIEKRGASEDIGVDAILIMPEVLTNTSAGWEIIRDFAAEHNLPVSGVAAFQVESGAIFTYVPDSVEVGRLAAALADKIFKGVPAGSIMVVTPKGYLHLNKGLARKLGLEIDGETLSITDKVLY